MNSAYNTLFCLCLLSILLATLVGVIRYKQYSIAMKIIVYGLIVTSISETAGFIVVNAHRYALRYTFYHFYDIIESVLTTSYFIYVLKPNNQERLMKFNVIFWPVIGVSNIIFFQPLGTMNTNMLMVESLMFISLSLFLIYETIRQNKVDNIFKYPHFWMAVLILLLWCSSFFFWAFVHSLYVDKWKYRIVAMYLQSIIEAIVYLGTAATLYLYNRKMEIND